MSDNTKILDKTENDSGYDSIRNEILDRIASLRIDCPECETIRYDDEQYQCGTCGSSNGKLNVLNWLKEQLK